jgi:hypothetical protein
MTTLTTIFIFVVGTAVLYQWRKRPTMKAFIGGAAMALAFALPHMWFTKETDGYLPLFTIVLCAVYALFALGLNVVVGFAGLLDLGYVAFFLFGPTSVPGTCRTSQSTSPVRREVGTSTSSMRPARRSPACTYRSGWSSSSPALSLHSRVS